MIYKTTQNLSKCGFIDKCELNQYGILCVKPIPAYSPEKIRTLQDRYRISHAVLEGQSAGQSGTSMISKVKWKTEISLRFPFLPKSKPAGRVYWIACLQHTEFAGFPKCNSAVSPCPKICFFFRGIFEKILCPIK